MVWIEVWDNRMKSWDRYYYSSVVEARHKALLLLKGEYGKHYRRIDFYRKKNSRKPYAHVERYMPYHYEWAEYNSQYGVKTCDLNPDGTI